MTSRPISIRLTDETICQVVDILTESGVITTNMSIASMIRLVVEGACRHALREGATRHYTESDIKEKLSAQKGEGTNEFVSHYGTHTTLNTQDVDTKREHIEEELRPYVERAVQQVEKQRFSGVLDIEHVPSVCAAPPPILKAPWEGVSIQPLVHVQSLTQISPYIKKAFESENNTAIIAAMLALPHMPDGLLGTQAGERLFRRVEQQIAVYTQTTGEDVPDPAIL